MLKYFGIWYLFGYEIFQLYLLQFEKINLSIVSTKVKYISEQLTWDMHYKLAFIYSYIIENQMTGDTKSIKK